MDSSSHLTPHPNFYQPTGDLILQVENFLFKIPRGPLLTLSPVVKDLVENAERASPSIRRKNEHEGITKLVLSDKARDWHDMFSLLQSAPNQFYPPRLGNLPYRDISKAVETVSPILRLASKYMIPRIRADAVDILSQVIPSESWHALVTLNTRNEYFPVNKETLRQIIRLCRGIGLGRFIPWAFYECARSTAGEITTFTDLSGADRTAILAGRDVIIQMQRTQTYCSFTHAFEPGPDCTDSDGCMIDREAVKMFDSMLSRGVGPLILVDAEKMDDPELCNQCMARARREIRGGQVRLWDNLPLMFGLPTWQILRDQDA